MSMIKRFQVHYIPDGSVQVDYAGISRSELLSKLDGILDVVDVVHVCKS